MRFVLDTNLLVSGIISAGLPRQLVDAAKAGVFELCTSETLLAELLDVLSRHKFAARLAGAGLTPTGIVNDLRRLAIVVSPPSVPRVIVRDPDDDYVLGAAGHRQCGPCQCHGPCYGDLRGRSLVLAPAEDRLDFF